MCVAQWCSFRDSPSFIRCSTGIYTWTAPFPSSHKRSLYINFSPSVDVCLFADGTKCFTVVNSLADACVLKSEAENVEKWAQTWRLNSTPQNAKY